MAVFKSLKEMLIQEITTPSDTSQIKRKSILLTFSFSQTSPISEETRFSENFLHLLENFHK